MAKYTSGRQKNLKIGIQSYSEDLTSLEVIGKVGIGTTNPISKLYVVGDGIYTGVVTATAFYGSGIGLTGLNAAPSTISDIELNSTYYPLLSPISSGTISTISVSSTSIVFNPANNYLGIGTTNPKSNLDIATPNGSIIIGDIPDLPATTNANISFRSGITTTNTASVSVNADVTSISFSINNANVTSYPDLSRVGGSFGIDTRTTGSGNTSSFAISGFPVGASHSVGYGVRRFKADLDNGDIVMAYPTSIHTLDGRNLRLGNVGIGTEIPKSKLHVVGDGIYTGVVTATAFYGSGIGLTGIISGEITDTNSTNVFYPLLSSTISGTISSVFVSSQTLAFNPGTAALGIRTNNPTSALHFAGIGTVSSTGDNSRFRIGDYHWDNVYTTIHAKKVRSEWWLEQNSDDTDGVDMIFYKSRGWPNQEKPVKLGDNVFRLTARTYKPGRTAVGSSITLADWSSDSAGQIEFNVDQVTVDNALCSMDFKTDSTSRLLITSFGNVGIASTLPRVKFDVRGDSIVTGVVTATAFYGSGIGLTGLNAAPSTISDIELNSTYYPLLSPISSGTISTISVSSTSIVFNPALNYLGIGTTNPTTFLDLPFNSSTQNTVQFGAFGIQGFDNGNGFISVNGYWNGNSWVYRKTGYTSLIQFLNGNINWRTVGIPTSGTAGAGTTTLDIYTRLSVDRSGSISLNRSDGDTSNSHLLLDIRRADLPDEYPYVSRKNPFLVGVTTNGEVGIATTNPKSKLHVVGDGYFTGVITATSFSGSGTNLTGIVTSITAGSGISVNQSTGNVTITAAGAAGAISNTIQDIDDNKFYYPLLSPVTSGTISSISVSSNSIVFNPGTNSLGIGTTNPISNLHFATPKGDITFGDIPEISGTTDSVLSFLGAGSTNRAAVLTELDRQTLCLAINCGQITTTPNLNRVGGIVRIDARDESYWVGVAASQAILKNSFDVTGFPIGASHSVGYGIRRFNVNLNDGTTYLVPSGGNVGVATTNPTSRLTVSGDGLFTGVVTATAFYGSGIGITGLVSNEVVNINNNQLYYPMLSSVTSGTIPNFSVSSNSIVFNPAANSLGIGTTSANAALEVYSQSSYGDGIRVSGTVVDGVPKHPGFRLFYADGSNRFAQNLLALTAGASISGSKTGDYCIRNNGGGDTIFSTDELVAPNIGSLSGREKFRITTLGQIGLNSPAPIAAVDIRRQIGFTSTTGPGLSTSTYTGDYVAIGNSGGDVLKVTSNGKVGIGTTNPTSKLHVIGDTNITGNALVDNVSISSGIITATTGIVTYYGDGSKLSGISTSGLSVSTQQEVSYTVYPTLASAIGVSTLGILSSKLSYIPSSSRFGIGTDNPRESLDVIGTIGIQTSGSPNRFYLKHNSIESSLDFIFV